MLKKTAAVVITVFLATSAWAQELIMVEQEGCIYCEMWDAEIGPIYSKTVEGKAAPLRKMDLDEEYPADLSFTAELIYTPTFVLVEDGRELARIEGYPGPDFFWWVLAEMLRENTQFDGQS